jgi:L-alanine-DL-glutamate epimerase-like enolase superfamily enzyme
MTRIRYGKQQVEATDMDWLGCVMRYGHAGGAVIEGPQAMAAAALEIALWDVAATAAGVPVHDLLGGRFRSRTRMYADLHMAEDAPDPIAAFEEAAGEAVEAGFDVVKFDLDLAFPDAHLDPWNRVVSNAELELMITLVRSAKAALDGRADLALDCHFQFGAHDAVRVRQALEEVGGIYWLEDPVPYGNPEALAGVARNSGVPIAFGEYVPAAERLYPYLAAGACHVIHPDVGYCGLIEAKKMAWLADMFSVPLALHNSGGPVATVASAHVAAASRNFLVLENHNSGVPWWTDIVKWRDAEIQGPHVVLTRGPGLGVELDFDAARSHIPDLDALL